MFEYRCCLVFQILQETCNCSTYLYRLLICRSGFETLTLWRTPSYTLCTFSSVLCPYTWSASKQDKLFGNAPRHGKQCFWSIFRSGLRSFRLEEEGTGSVYLSLVFALNLTSIVNCPSRDIGVRSFTDLFRSLARSEGKKSHTLYDSFGVRH